MENFALNNMEEKEKAKDGDKGLVSGFCADQAWVSNIISAGFFTVSLQLKEARTTRTQLNKTE